MLQSILECGEPS